VFQDLTVDLMAGEPGLRLARLYGRRGQKQFGGDAIAECISGGSAVAQCKCYEELNESDVANACDEFHKDLSHWKKYDTKRFILVTACDAISTKVLAEIDKQKRRFLKKSIAFETWDRIIVVQKLGLLPNLVHKYLGGSSTWVSILCGPQEDRRASISSSTSDAERHLLESMLASHFETEVKNLKEVLRKGRRGEVRARLKSFRDNSTKWALLSPNVRAAALRLEAALELDSEGNSQRAKAHVVEACRLDPDVSVIRLETRIRLIERGPEEALKALPDKDDLDTLCARGSILIVLGNVDEALRTLNAAKMHDPNDADTLRLLALAYLANGNVSLAQRLLADLVSIAPDWEVVRRTKAVINYVSALSSPDLQTVGSAIPEPVEWSLVRRDDESLQRLTESETIFGDLLSDTDRSRSDRQILEIWRLACLANHPSRQNEALEYCSKLVGQHPCNIYALPWALARGYQVDFNRLASIAEVEIQRNPSALGPILIAVASRLNAQDGPGASSLLKQHRSSFEQLGQIENWNYWWAIVQALSGDSLAALTFVRSLPPTPHLRRAEATALRAEARRTGDTGPLVERLIELYALTVDPLFLAELCNQYAASGNWAAVNELSSALLDKVPTTDSLYLALLADYNTHDFDRCLRRAEQYRNWFPGNRLPLDLRRMRIDCLERRGLVSRALEDAKELLEEDASPETLVSFVSLCMRFGDTQAAVLWARQLSEREDITPEQRIRVSELITPFAPDLGRRLIRSVAPTEIPPERVLSALRLGSQLELESEVHELLQRGLELAKQGTIVRTLQQEELAELRQYQQSAQTNVVNAYELGQIPIHFLIDEFRFNLAEIYWRDNGPIFLPLSQPHVLTRHGKRSEHDLATTFPASTRLNLDVTSLLLVQRFHLWDAVQAAFTEVRFSANVIPFLQETLHWAGSDQPAADRAKRHVVELWQTERIDTDTTNADRVVELQAQPDNSSQLNPRFIAEELRARGLLSSSEYDHAIETLGAFGKVESVGTLPETSRTVYCPGTSALLFATAGLLQPLCLIITVLVDRALLDWLQAEVTHESQLQAVTERLKGLIQFLGRELQIGRLHLIPEGARNNTLEKPCSRCIADLLLFEASRDDVVCVDDRFSNGHLKREGDIQVTTLYDLLPTLLERGFLTAEKSWQLVHDFRMANLWFIPLNAAEIVHHLKQAAVNQDGVIETPELKAIRQYWGGCAAHAHLLQRGNPASNPVELGEIPFLTKTRHAVAEALALIWAETRQSGQAKVARSAWLLDSLFLDIISLRRVVGASGPREMERELSALDPILLFVSGLSRMSLSGSGKRGIWEEYADWIWNRVFEKRCASEPEILGAVANQMARLFRTLSRSAKDDAVDQKAFAGMIHRIMHTLPEPLRERLESDRLLLSELGIETVKVITIGEFRFESKMYTAAVTQALVEGSARLLPLRTYLFPASR
jgi:tetratricopeptide (TPR) repeat protein